MAGSVLLPPLHDPILHRTTIERKLRLGQYTLDPSWNPSKSGSTTVQILKDLRREALNLQGYAAQEDDQESSNMKKKKKKKKKTSTALVNRSSSMTPSLQGLEGTRTSDSKGTLIVSAKSSNTNTANSTTTTSNNNNNNILSLPPQSTNTKRILTSSTSTTKIPTPKWHAPYKLQSVLSSHLGWVRSLAFDPTNDFFATGGADRVIKLFDLAKSSVGREDALKLTLTGHVGPVRGLGFSERHPYLFSAGEDKQVKVGNIG